MNRLKNLRRRSNKKAHKTKNPTLLWGCKCDPVWIRTKDLLLRRQLLYPTELRDRCNQKRGMIAHPPCRGGRIRTCDLLVPNQARWPDYATPRTEVRYGLNLWRWERDSNSRYSYPYDSLANCWFQPLTHPTMCSMNGWQKYKNIPFLKAFFRIFLS